MPDEPFLARAPAENPEGVVWRGIETLRPMLVPLEAISQHPRNPKDHDLGAIAASLARFGQQQPIVVQKSTGWIIAGNGRWEAAPMVGEMEKALGFGLGKPWTHIAVVLSELAEDEALAYALADNRTTELGGWHDEKLAELLAELAGKNVLAGTGYDAEDVDELLASLRPMVPADLVRREPTLGSEVTIEIRCGRAFLSEIDKTLAEWGKREGVEVSIA